MSALDGETETSGCCYCRRADYQLGNRYAINGSVNYLPLDEQRVDFVAVLATVSKIPTERLHSLLRGLPGGCREALLAVQILVVEAPH